MIQRTNEQTAALDADDLRCRAAVYRLLGRLWRLEVDEATLAELVGGSMRDAFRDAGGVLPEASEQTAIDELAFDYCQIFLGPSSHLPPYQSVWTEGQFQGAAIASLSQFIDLLATDQWAGEAMLDHLGIELEVMASLLEQVAIAIDLPEALPISEEIAASFFYHHLMWCAPLCDAARDRAQTAFYRSMIDMTAAFFADEQAAFGLQQNQP